MGRIRQVAVVALMAVVVSAVAVAAPGARGFHERPALEANDPALGQRNQCCVTCGTSGTVCGTSVKMWCGNCATANVGQAGQTTVHSQYAFDLQGHVERVTPTPGDGPAPFPGPTPPHAIEADGGTAGPESVVREPGRVSFGWALRDVYLGQMTAAIRKPDGSLKMIVGCPERVAGSDRALADRLMNLPLPNAFYGAIKGFQGWYAGAVAAGVAGRLDLAAAWQSYAAAWLAAHPEAVEQLRPMVADAVMAAGLRRADDLMVTPAFYVAPLGARAADCITCTPPLVCTCQTYDAATADCAGAAQSCTVIELGARMSVRLP